MESQSYLKRPKFTIAFCSMQKQSANIIILSDEFIICNQIFRKLAIISMFSHYIIAKNVINKFMFSIADLYQASHTVSTGGVQGYYVQKKYIDAAKIKEQKMYQDKDKSFSSTKPVNVSKKTTFIDDVQKISKKLPAPGQYQPKQIVAKSKTAQLQITHPDRKTIFDEMQTQAKKKNIPGSGTYSKVQVDVDKTKLRSNLSRAQSPSYVQASMRNSLECPGVGNYNAYRAMLDKRGGKMSVQSDVKPRSSTQIKLPSVGTYDPQPASYSLFSSKLNKRNKSIMDRSQRFKQQKQKKVPFYNILSEWGLEKKKKKDILSKVSTHSQRSVYY